MILGIDASSANKEKKTGVEWYAFNLIQAMKTHALGADDRVRLYSPTPLTGALAALPAGWESKVLNWPLGNGWMQGRVSWEMWRRPPNVLFVPSQALPRLHPKATVTMIHDIGFARRPDLYEPATRKRLEKVTRFALKRAKTVLVPSAFTKAELMSVYKTSADRLVVTPEAVDHAHYRQMTPEEIEPVLQKYRLGRKNYFLAVGRLELKKNLGTIIRAFEIFKQGRGFGDPFELALAGPPGFGFQTVKQYHDLSPAKDAIKGLGWVPEEDLPALIAGAYAYLFPSWYEGFGIPSVEAMACGTPLLCSDIPAHREVAGNAALFVPAGEPDAWALALKRIAADARSADEFVQNGLLRAKQFTWEATAQKTWAVLRSLL